MTAFDVDAALLLVAAFALGGLAALLMLRRARRRRMSTLAQATILSLAESAGEKAEIQAPGHESVPLAPLEPELPLDLPPDLPPEPRPDPAGWSAPRPQAGGGGRVRRQAEAGELARAEAGSSQKPPVLEAPDGTADDLKRLKGIGPQNERRLNALGIFHLRQIAAWTPEEARWVGAYLAFPGRIEREGWVSQAKALLEDDAPPPAAPGGT